MTGLQAQRPYPGADRYGPPKPYPQHYEPEYEPVEYAEPEESPCALVVPGLPGKSAAVDRYAK